MMGPNVCPTSMIVLRKPMPVPMRDLLVISLTSAGVDEVTIEKPIPYRIEINRRREE